MSGIPVQDNSNLVSLFKTLTTSHVVHITVHSAVFEYVLECLPSVVQLKVLVNLVNKLKRNPQGTVLRLAIWNDDNNITSTGMY